jgi:hypothetical protein
VEFVGFLDGVVGEFNLNHISTSHAGGMTHFFQPMPTARIQAAALAAVRGSGVRSSSSAAAYALGYVAGASDEPPRAAEIRRSSSIVRRAAFDIGANHIWGSFDVVRRGHR